MRVKEKEVFKLSITAETWTTFNGQRIPHIKAWTEIFTNPRWACNYGDEILKQIGLANYKIPYELVLTRIRQRGKYINRIILHEESVRVEITPILMNPDPAKFKK